MDKPKNYATATAFRRALEDRLKLIAQKERAALERLRRGVTFDRLLARLFGRDDAPWVLKGGYALEIRIKEARATRDIDLALRHTLGKAMGAALNDAILKALRAAAATGSRFAGIDILYDHSGNGFVIEVNAVPGWQAFQKVTGTDVAREVIEAVTARRGRSDAVGLPTR